MKIFILDNGWLECDAKWIVPNPNQNTDNNNQNPIQLKLPVYAVLIELDNGSKILFDTGCNPDAMTGKWPRSLQDAFPYFHHQQHLLENQLALTDTKPEDISTVILSHIHTDHAGGLKLFPHADVWVHKADYEQGHHLIQQFADPNQRGAYVEGDFTVPVKSWNFVQQDMEIVPGVKVMCLPGHTPGVLGLVLTLPNSGTLIFPSDGIYTAANYGPPVKLPGIVYEAKAYVESVEKVRKLAEETGGRVFFSHDVESFKTMKKAPEYYD